MRKSADLHKNSGGAIRKLGSFYFIYFGILGIFLPFFNLYCKDIGFSGFQIGMITAIQPVVRLVFPVFWGYCSDRFGWRSGLIRWPHLGVILSFIALLWFKSFTGVAVIIFFYTFFLIPILPLWEANVLERLESIRKEYGHVRLWGSLGFIFFSLFAGKFIDYYPIERILIVILLLIFLNFLVSLLTPLKSKNIPDFRSLDGSWFKNPKIRIFLMSCALMQASHGTYYAFFSIFMNEQGLSNTFIALLWTIGVVFEILVMLWAGALIRRYGYERLFALTFFAAGLRWFLSSFIVGGPIFIFIQGLHGLSFGLFHVCAVTWVSKLVPRGFQATGQSLYNSVTYGVGGILGFLMNAFLYDYVGARGLWFIDAWIAFGGLALSFILVLKRGKVI